MRCLAFGPVLARLCVVRAWMAADGQQGFVARNLAHSAAIYTARGDLYDVPVAERLPRRLHGVPSPVGAARGTEAAPAFAYGARRP